MDSQTALTELKKAQSERKGAGEYYAESQKQLGVDTAQTRQNELRDVIRNTEAQLKGVGQSVAGRTRGNLVTEAQRSRLQALETQPLAERLSNQQGAYSDEAQNYRDLLSQASSRAGMMYQTDADKLAALEGNYNKAFSSEQALKAEQQWRQQLEENRRQTEADLAERRRQFDANIANTKAQYAQMASMYQPSITSTANNAAQQAALEAETTREYNKQVNAQIAQEAAKTKSSLPQYQTGNFLNDLGSSIGTYGPMALFGKGYLW